MKYGLLIHKPTSNLGDDIQSYAIERFLPQVDYLVDREWIHSFKSDKGEPVATVMAAWWMRYKWAWPPSKDIYPLFVGWHYSDQAAAKQAGCPVGYDFLTGIGGKYLEAYGPVGCRDEYTLQSLKDKGIEAEFSGCITLTLPKQKKVPHEREYICLVDVSAKVEKYVRARLEGTDIDIKVITHDVDQKAYKTLQWSERSQIVEDTLTVYQNAKCVLTRRLHCALPCLAMGVPVLLVIHTLESIRFDPYYDWLRCCKPEQYISGEYDFDVLNPPDNKTNHLETRRSLTRKVEEFIADTMNRDHPEELLKFHVPEKKVEKWRYKKMLSAAKTWYHVNRADREEIRDLQKTEKGSGRNRKQLSLLTEQEYFEEWEKFRKSLFLRTIPEKNQMLEQRMLVELRYMRKNYDEMKRLKNKLKK